MTQAPNNTHLRANVLLWLAGGWLVGIAAGALIGGAWWAGAAGAIAAGSVTAAVRNDVRYALLGSAAAALLIAGGLWYEQGAPPSEPTGIGLHNDGAPVRVRGLVAEAPQLTGRSQRFRLDVQEIYATEHWQAINGGVLVRTGQFPRFEYGDMLEVTGALKTPPSFPDFNYREYLAMRGVQSMISYGDVEVVAQGKGNPVEAKLIQVRREIGDALQRVLPEPHAALAAGIFAGQRSSIPEDLTANMNATGTSHLVAVSGQNIAIVAALTIVSLAWLIGRRNAAIVALLAIAAYAVLTGGSASIVRAAIMGALFVTATMVGRPSSAAIPIALAAGVMTALEPMVVHDVSFQLSFSAVLGLVYLAPLIERQFANLLADRGIEATESGVAAYLTESSAVTLAAIAATLPLVALHFDRISLIAPIANLPLVIVFPIILVSSCITAIASMTWTPLGELAAWPTWFVLTYMIETVRFFADLPLASIGINNFGRVHAAVAYAAIGLIAWSLAQRARTNAPVPMHRAPLMRPKWLLIGGLAVVAGLTWSAALGSNSERLQVSVLDVGQGDAILIETPSGDTMLIDGGASGLLLAERLSEQLPFWERQIDLVALTHPQEDHMGGLVDLFDRFEVNKVIAAPSSAESAAYDEWRRNIRDQSIAYDEMTAGDAIDLGDGAHLRVLWPDEDFAGGDDLNNTSLVMKLTWHDVSFLLTGDIEAEAEEALLSSPANLQATVLKVAHHGSATSSSEAFLRATGPEIAIVSVGDSNPYGHPSPAIIDRLKEESLVLRTDQLGTIRLETDGLKLWVKKK